MPVPAIILAAGGSRRLGQPKQLVRIAGETLLARAIRVVRASASDPIFVVLGAHHENIRAAVDLSHVRVVMNPDWEQGIATSIHAGIRELLELDPHAAAALLLVCDQPRLTTEHLRTLIKDYEHAGEPGIVASRYGGAAGIPAIFPKSQFSKLLALQGDEGARHLLRNPENSVVEVEFSDGEIDIDTPSNLAAQLKE